LTATPVKVSGEDPNVFANGPAESSVRLDLTPVGTTSAASPAVIGIGAVTFTLGATGVPQLIPVLLATGATDNEAITGVLSDPLLLAMPLQIKVTELNCTNARHAPSNIVDMMK